MNHGAGGYVVIFGDKTTRCSMTGDISWIVEDYDIQRIYSYLKEYLSVDYGRITDEVQYIRIPRQVIVERYIGNGTLDDPKGGMDEYKFMCFNYGKSFWVEVINYKTNEFNVFDENWMPADASYLEHILKYDKNLMKKPKHFDKMVQLVKKLAEDLPFARIDLYELDDQIFFGEYTFTPSGGHLNFPHELNRKYGELATRPKDA